MVEISPDFSPASLNRLKRVVATVVLPLVPVIPTNFIFFDGLS